MNLKTSPRTIIKIVVWSLVLVLFMVFFIRVLAYENWYYNDREGTEREVIESVSEEEELIEEPPAEKEVEEYVVAADKPRYLTIPKLGIEKARILAVGKKRTGEMDTPNNIFDVGWYDGSSKPGQNGTMIIDGHNGGPNIKGVFKNLPSLKNGDIVTIERGDGITYNYKVVESVKVALEKANEYMKVAAMSPEEGKESVTIISCTGEWSSKQQTYLSRQFVRAVLTD